MQHQSYMSEILKIASDAANQGEVPIAAVVVDAQGEVLSMAHNMVEQNKNPLHHAECIALTQAIIQRGEKYLDDCTLYVTLEPCAMCAGAIAHARVKRVVYAAYDPKGGAVEHNARVLDHSLQKVEIIGGVMERESQDIIVKFFQNFRQ